MTEMNPLPATNATLNETSTDDLGRITMALIQEVWIMRDRMAITEKLLEEKAGITPDMINDYTATAQTRADIDALRTLFVNRTIGAPLAATERTVPKILARAGFAPKA